MSSPQTAVLTADLASARERWLAITDGAERDRLYATEFGPGFARLFAELPLHRAASDFFRPSCLVSILGLSWQSAALMAAWVKPRRVLLLGTQESLGTQVSTGESPAAVVARVSGVAPGVIESRTLSDDTEVEIYQAVRQFIRTGELLPRDVAVDPTGGKKSMSVAAGLAGFLEGCPIIYVDYAEYDRARRVPLPGSEYPRLLANPLDVLGDLEFDRIREAFNRGDYAEAARWAESLAERLYQPREAQTLAALARAYNAWARFEFSAAIPFLRTGRDLLSRYALQGAWDWARDLTDRLRGHETVLAQLAATTERPRTTEEGVALVCNHVAAARRALSQQRLSEATLLAYAAVERYATLCLWSEFGLDGDDADYDRLQPALDENAYHELGRHWHGKEYVPSDLPRTLSYSTSARLLAALRPDLLNRGDIGVLKGLAERRNRTEFEHGLLPKPPSRGEVEKFVTKVWDIIRRHPSFSTVDVAAYQFPDL